MNPDKNSQNFSNQVLYHSLSDFFLGVSDELQQISSIQKLGNKINIVFILVNTEKIHYLRHLSVTEHLFETDL